MSPNIPINIRGGKITFDKLAGNVKTIAIRSIHSMKYTIPHTKVNMRNP